MLDDLFFMKQAFLEAQKALAKGEVPVGAVVVCRNTIIARAHNLTETLRDVTAHAEMQAITMASDYLGGKYLVDCSIYVTVEPCVMCAGALGWAQISRLVYGRLIQKEDILFLPLTHFILDVRLFPVSWQTNVLRWSLLSSKHVDEKII